MTKNNQTSVAKLEIEKLICEEKELYNGLTSFLQKSDDGMNDIQYLSDIINKQNIEDNCEKFEEFLKLLLSIANNHRCQSFLFTKLFQIIEHYEVQIKQTFSNIDIFNIFKSNKRILHFLFEKEILVIDDDIYNKLHSNFETNGNFYCHFFYPEIKKALGEEKVKDIEKELITKDANIFDQFDEKRHEGENDSFICSLIRKDLVKEFIEYVNRNNISLESEVKSSIFETNTFLIENKSTTLIEYSAFFGSIQIFQYLVLNKVELKSSLWLYAIHSRNAELIHLLEYYSISPPNGKYDQCFYESIKCHHNEIGEYIENNLLPPNYDKTQDEEFLSTIIQFHNYVYFPSVFENGDEFYYLYRNEYQTFVKLFIEMKEEYIKEMIVEKV